MLKNRKLETITEAAGWIGVLAILLAYALISFQIVNAESVWYHGLNLVGGVGIIVDAVADKNYQPAVLNVVWIAIAMYALTRLYY